MHTFAFRFEHTKVMMMRAHASKDSIINRLNEITRDAWLHREISDDTCLNYQENIKALADILEV